MNHSGDSSNYLVSSLYVGDLHPDVNESMLFQKFAAVGHILSIRVCRDMVTRRSLGYAYVNYQQRADAEKALDTMNFDIIKGRPIRIMWSQRDLLLRKSGLGNIFVKNLDKRIDIKAMYDTFSTFGNILSYKVALDESGVSKGYGFVHFEYEEAAIRAIETVNGMLLNGKKVFVGRFYQRNLRDERGLIFRPFTNVYVGNLEPETSDTQLHDIFCGFGEIASHFIMRDENGNSKCFGFVSFKKHENAVQAVQEMKGKVIVEGGKPLYVARAQMSGRQIGLRRNFQQFKHDNNCQGLNVYVKNLDNYYDDDWLYRKFCKFGNIVSAKVMMESGQSRGFGFVCFSTQEEASKAVAEMNGRRVNEGQPLFVAIAQSKEERKAYLMLQSLQRMNSRGIEQISPMFSSPINRPNISLPISSQLHHFYGAAPLAVTVVHPATYWSPQPALAYPEQLSAVQQITTQNVYRAHESTGLQEASIQDHWVIPHVQNHWVIPQLREIKNCITNSYRG